jgi:nucleotide sugar dehydrogenase
MEKTTQIGIVGLGYVGLPLALRSLEKGFKVIGVDSDENKIEKIKKGESPFLEEFIEKRKLLLKKLPVSTNPHELKNVDIIIVCVPTPIDKSYYPNLKPLQGAVQSIIDNLGKNQLVIIESTINPGVCEEVLMPMFSEKNLEEGRDYYLAHCPERIDPGNEKWNISNINRVVGAVSKEGLERAVNYYESIIDGDIKPMKSIKAAESVKVVENSFRDVNIAFVNELAQSFDQMGIDVKDVIDGAATKPFAFMAHYPSRGVGGHCIPVDPYYLIEEAKRKGFDHQFLRTARRINNYMPFYTVKILQDTLNEIEKPLKNTRVGVLGLSYKANIDDLRESPAFKIIDELKKKKADISVYDPYIKDKSDVKSLEELLEKVEALVLITNHKDFLAKEDLFKKFKIKAIVDGVNCLDGEKIKKFGIKYHGIGRS